VHRPVGRGRSPRHLHEFHRSTIARGSASARKKILHVVGRAHREIDDAVAEHGGGQSHFRRLIAAGVCALDAGRVQRREGGPRQRNSESRRTGHGVDAHEHRKSIGGVSTTLAAGPARRLSRSAGASAAVVSAFSPSLPHNCGNSAKSRGCPAPPAPVFLPFVLVREIIHVEVDRPRLPLRIGDVERVGTRAQPNRSVLDARLRLRGPLEIHRRRTIIRWRDEVDCGRSSRIAGTVVS
jgi:hypothetical protein